MCIRDTEKTFSKKTREEWIKILDIAGVPCGPIYDIKEAWNDEQIQFRDMKIELNHPKTGKHNNIGVVAKFLEKPSSLRTPSPLLGEHTEKILLENGYSKKEIADYKKNGAIS